MEERLKETSKEISKEVIRKTEKEKRGGYLLLDIGGTEIKGCVSDAEGEKTRIRKFPSQAQKSAEKILDNFSRICRELLKDVDGSVCGVGLAIPGPFDYQKGISRMQGLNKYDSIYGIPLEPEIKARVPELKEAQFLFLHDIEAFALGESWYGTCRGAEKILCVCIGTGAGSAFVEHRKTIKTGCSRGTFAGPHSISAGSAFAGRPDFKKLPMVRGTAKCSVRKKRDPHSD